MTIEFKHDLSVIIGQNDVGKSTILEALEIFINNETIKIDASDLNVRSSNEEIGIGVAFEVEEENNYLIDANVKTNLRDEFLLNKEGMLEIHKVWDCSKGKITAASLSTFLRANYPKEFEEKPLIGLKITDLRKVLEEYKEKIEDYEDIHKNTSSEIRKAIYSCHAEPDLQEIDILLDKEDGKRLYETINKNEFPLFFLFQTDRANKDTDKEVQDPLKAITKQAIEEVESQLEVIKDEIEKKAIQIGEDTLEKLKEMAPEIANTLKPNVTNKAWETLFSFSFDGDDGIPINKRGSGIRRLILLNYFRAEADRKNISDKKIIYAIEEPETSQHPNYQIMLIEALNEISQKDSHQVIITTHTPEIVKLVDEESIILISREGNKPELIDGEDKLHRIIKTLGIMPYMRKLVIFVEGENDVKFLRNINRNIEELREIIDFEESNITIIPLFGGNLINWVNRNYFKDFNVREFHLYDKDKNEQYKETIEKVNNRGDGSTGLLTEKREMENYIPASLIEEHFKIDCSEIKTEWDEIDITQFIQNKIGNKMKDNDIKSILNGYLSKSINKEMLDDINAFDEIAEWHNKINKLWLEC